MLSEKSRIQNWIYTVIATIENWLCMQTRLGKNNMENTSDQFVKEKCIEGVSFKTSCPSYKVIVQFSKLLKLSQGWNCFFFLLLDWMFPCHWRWVKLSRYRKDRLHVTETVTTVFPLKKSIFKAHDVIVDLLMHILYTDIIIAIHH